ncbi:MAG: response regulator [Proteobacteria bacterium]|nr:response regulator [Pseudomonadota bacterium]
MEDVFPTSEIHILVADDDRLIRTFVAGCLESEPGYCLASVTDGSEALEVIRKNPPDILITDWMMPGIDGPELCRQVRRLPLPRYVYIILLTVKNEQREIIEGLSSGGDDYMVKPFNREELTARVRAGARIARAQKALHRTNRELEAALRKIETLQGLLPICMDCRRVRTDQDYWMEIEEYVSSVTRTEFTHGLCPDCFGRRLRELEKLG